MISYLGIIIIIIGPIEACNVGLTARSVLSESQKAYVKFSYSSVVAYQEKITVKNKKTPYEFVVHVDSILPGSSIAQRYCLVTATKSTAQITQFLMIGSGP